MLKELKLTSQDGDATLVLKQHPSAGLDGTSVVIMSIKTKGGEQIGAVLTLKDVKALVEPGAGVQKTPYSRNVYIGGSLASAGETGGKSHIPFHYPTPRSKTRQTIIGWLNAAISEFDTKKEPAVADTPTIPTSYKITDSAGDSVTFSASGKGGVKLEFVRLSFDGSTGTMTLDASRSKSLVGALRKAASDGRDAYTSIRPGGSRTLDISAGWIDGPISVCATASEQTAAADFVEKLLGLSAKGPEAVAAPVFKFKVGREGTVEEIIAWKTPTQCGVKPTEGTTWWYPASALEKIEAAAPTPANTAVPVFGPLPAGFAGMSAQSAERMAKHAGNASEAIWSGFTWSTTPEGHKFWHAVTRRLDEIAKIAEAASKPARRPDADYKSACPAGYETLAMATLRYGRPDDATAELGGRVSRKAAERGLPVVWVEAPAVAKDVASQVRAYHRADLMAILSDLGVIA